MIIEQREHTLDVCDVARILNGARIHESVLCLAVHELSRQELHLVAGDAQLAASVDEARDAESGCTAVVVFASGLELARELLRIGVLDGSASIHWHLGLDLPETLDVLDAMAGVELAHGMSVTGINQLASGIVVTTGHAGAGTDMLDANSFRRGVQAASLHRQQQEPIERSTGQETERLLRQKLLHTLQVVEPLLDTTPSCARAHDVAAEKQLIQLKRKYDALERRYKSLATSQLGKVTLRLWARKNASRHGRSTAPRAR